VQPMRPVPHEQQPFLEKKTLVDLFGEGE
jgi:hypothetical protein